MKPVRALALLLAIAVSGCARWPQADDGLARRVDGIVAPLVAAQQFSGAVALMRDGRLLYARGFGLANQALGLGFTSQTASDGGSIAKTFTAAGVWWLVHEGRLSPQQRVQALVPEYPHADTTVAQLLAHSTGLAPAYESFDRHFAPGQARTTEALLRIAGRDAPAPSFQPGTRFEYANLAYDTAALVIERVSGQRYEDFVRQRFFEPHGLVDSFARPPRFADWPGPRTRGYRFRQGRWQDHDAYDDEAFLGASNLMFSARDLAHWGDAWARARALPPAAERVGREAPLISGHRSAINGLSWYCAPEATRCHYTGSLNGFHALVYWDRARRESVAFVSNSAIPPLQTIALQRALVDALAGRPVTPPDSAVAGFKRIGADALPQLAGRYRLDGGDSVRLHPAGQGLQLQLADGLMQDMFQVSAQVFYVPGLDWWVAFSDAAPQRPRLHVHGMYRLASGVRQDAE